MTKYCKARIFIAAFYTFPGLAFAFQAGDGLSPEALERLRQGEIVVQEQKLESSGGTVMARALVEASAETIWNTIASCRNALRYLPGMEDCEVLVDETQRALTHHVVDPGWFAPLMDYRFETRREPFRRMDFELVEGTMRQMEGYWDLRPMEQGTLVEYQIRIVPRAPVPRWLIRRKLKNDLPQMMTCIRGLAGGSLTQEGARDDLESCAPPREGQ